MVGRRVAFQEEKKREGGEARFPVYRMLYLALHLPSLPEQPTPEAPGQRKGPTGPAIDLVT